MRRNGIFVGTMVALAVYFGLTFIGKAFADTLTAVAPPTDWFGIAFVSGIAVLAVAVTGYVHYVRTKAGMQLGEEQIEMILNAWHKKTQVAAPIAIAAPDPALVFDGIPFATQADLDEYKAAKAVMDKHKGGPT